jgi:hypothetical protein
MRTFLSTAVLISSTLSLAGVAHAQTADAKPAPSAATTTLFGRRSSVILGVDNVLGYTSEGISKGGTTFDDKGFFAGTFGPRFGFDSVSENGLTFGTGVQFWRIHAKGSSDDLTMFGLAPRVGYAAPLGGPLGVWARGGPYFLMLKEEESSLYVSLRLELFFVVSVVEHFGILLGPSFDFGLVTSRSRGSNDGTWHTQDMLVGFFGEL